MAKIDRLDDRGAEQLAWREVSEEARRAMVKDLDVRGIAEAGDDFFSGFVWVATDGGVEVYHRTGKVPETTGDRAAIADGRVVPRSEIAAVVAFANDDYGYRSVNAAWRSRQEIPLVTEASGQPWVTRHTVATSYGWRPAGRG